MSLKVWTLVGTRPEIIRLAPTIKLFDSIFDHSLIHTGQNSGENMSDVFFRDLELREPDHFLGSQGSNLGDLLGEMFSKFGTMLDRERPDAVVVLGDTNSALLMILARRAGIATYHLEAGNRAFDARVPEETNRRIVDHTADFNLVYNSYSQSNLIREGLPSSRIFVTGSPMREVIYSLESKILTSNVHRELQVEKGSYLVGSFHRQENVDSPQRLEKVIDLANGLTSHFGMKMIIPVHPRTRDKLESGGLVLGDSVMTIDPLGIVDYLALQQSSYATVSDSGTLAEESSILGFVGVSAREATERPEAYHVAKLTLGGLSLENCLEAIVLQRNNTSIELPEGYEELSFSSRVANIVLSTVRRRDFLVGDFRQHLS